MEVGEGGARELMTDLPTGTVTFLFTDLEDSSRLWERYPEAMSLALASHDEILRSVIEANNGSVVKPAGDGVHAAFWSATDALWAALEAQRALMREEWAEQIGPLQVRMALHTGATEEREGDYYGPPVNRAARLLSAAHGGQVLLSLATQELVRDTLPAGASLEDLGERRLKDLFRLERIYQLKTPDLPSQFPPLRTLEGRANNLPMQPTPLVGREREIEEIVEQLRSDQVRLLTLTGPGGTGKTRLALQAGADLLEEFEDGVFFVALAAITDPALVAPTVVRTLGLTERGAQPPEELLTGYLRDGQTLLLFDNFEQILDSAPLLDELLYTAPNLKILVTSRTPLSLYGEHEFPVPPLSLPDPSSLVTLESLARYEAIRLFVERAKAVRPNFALTQENAPAVAEICARLDGLPLAIELAGARVRMLPPQALLQRLSNRLKLLKGGPRNLPARQRTLRATIDWSYELLTEEEKQLLGRLSVFFGGCTLEAIEALCDVEGHFPMDTLEGVSSLLEKSLLRQEEGPEGEPRFVMLEVVQEYAREKLEESGAVQEIKRAHAEHYLALAEEADPELKGPDQLEWIRRLETEHDNMRVALRWAHQRGETELALRLGGALWWFWFVRGYYDEGRRWLEGALTANGRGSVESRAMALAGIGALALEQGDLDRAEEACQEGLELFVEEVSAGSEAKLYLLLSLGHVALDREDHSRATELFEESLALSREMGHGWGLARSVMALATVTHKQGDLKRATELYEESMDLFRDQGDKRGLARCLNNLGLEVYSLGDLGRAAKLTAESVSLMRELGAGADTALALCNLGWMALLQNDFHGTADFYEESLNLAWDTGMKPIVLPILEGYACMAGARGEARRAARLWGAAQVLHEAKGIPRDIDWLEEADERISDIRLRMDEQAWEGALAKGRAMTLEEAVAYALEKNEDR